MMAVTWLDLALLSENVDSHSATHLHKILHAATALRRSMPLGRAHGPGESQTAVTWPASKWVLSLGTRGRPKNDTIY